MHNRDMRKHQLLSLQDRQRVIKAASSPITQGRLKDVLTCVARGESRRQVQPAQAIALHRAAEALGMPVPRVWHLRTDWREVWPNLSEGATGGSEA